MDGLSQDTDGTMSLTSSQASSASEFVGAVEELNETMKPLSIEGGVMSGLEEQDEDDLLNDFSDEDEGAVQVNIGEIRTSVGNKGRIPNKISCTVVASGSSGSSTHVQVTGQPVEGASHLLNGPSNVEGYDFVDGRLKRKFNRIAEKKSLNEEDREHLRTNLRSKARRFNNDEPPHTTFSAKLQITPLGLVPAADNKDQFSREETGILRSAILEAIVDLYDQELRPRFCGISQEPGFVLAKASTEISVKWLEKHKDEIGRTCELPFLILTGDQIPNCVYAQANIKDGLEMENERILKRIQAQNYYTATSWEILHKQMDRTGVYTRYVFLISE